MRTELRLPALDLPGAVVSACTWHASVGARVVEGDRLLEVVAGDVTVELAAPASGVLAERHAEIDQPLAEGQLLAVIESEA